MSIEKKSLISTLKTTKKANVAKDSIENAPAGVNLSTHKMATAKFATKKFASKKFATKKFATKKFATKKFATKKFATKKVF